MKHPLHLVDKTLLNRSSAYINLGLRVYMMVIPLVMTVAIKHLIKGVGYMVRGKRKEQFVEFLAGAAIWGRYVTRVSKTDLELVNEIDPPDAGHLIFVNHVNELDFPFDSLVLRKPYLANQVIKKMLPAYLWMRAMGSQVFDNSQARSIKRSVDILLKHLPMQSFIVYPEGHNTYGEEIKPLRKGMLRVAFDNKIPVYVVLKAGVASLQKDPYGNRIAYKYCGTFDPAEYASWTALRDDLQAVMDREKRELNLRVARPAGKSGKADKQQDRTAS